MISSVTIRIETDAFACEIAHDLVLLDQRYLRLATWLPSSIAKVEIMRIHPAALAAVVLAAPILAGCRDSSGRPASAAHTATPAPSPGAPAALEMGGAKSVTRFFVTSQGIGRGGDLGGLAGADAHCQALATAEGSGDHTWRAYLSTSATPAAPAVNARDRIGKGPWYNALGDRVATGLDDLQKAPAAINEENALTERGDSVSRAAAILTGSRADGTAFPSGDDLTCANWTSARGGRAEMGAINAPHPRKAQSWNSAHPSRGCSQQDLGGARGALFYCFAVD